MKRKIWNAHTFNYNWLTPVGGSELCERNSETVWTRFVECVIPDAGTLTLYGDVCVQSFSTTVSEDRRLTSGRQILRYNSKREALAANLSRFIMPLISIQLRFSVKLDRVRMRQWYRSCTWSCHPPLAHKVIDLEVYFFMLLLSFESVPEILKCDHAN